MLDAVPPALIDHGALTLCRNLETAGFSAYLVGGCVRDLLMERSPGDWDIASTATPEQAISVLEPLGYAVRPTGLRFGTVSVFLEQRAYELTTLRSEGVYTDHRHPDSVAFTQSIEADLARRDFTINAMALRPKDDACQLIDCHRGLPDLRARIVRAVGNPAARFEEDALRIMRAARFAAMLGFAVEEGTLGAMRRCGGKLACIAMERIGAELRRILLSPHPEAVALLEGDAIEAVVPEASSAWRDAATKRRMLQSVTLAAPPDALADALADAATEDALFCARLALLLSQEKKPEAWQARSKELRLTKKQARTLLFILSQASAPPDERASLKRVLSRAELPEIIGWITYHRAFALADGDAGALGRIDASALMLADILQKNEPYRIDRLAINGHDLLPIGFRGPAIAEALEACLSFVLEEPERNTREELLSHIQGTHPSTWR